SLAYLPTLCIFFLLMICSPPISTLFPYTTLFRSHRRFVCWRSFPRSVAALRPRARSDGRLFWPSVRFPGHPEAAPAGSWKCRDRSEEHTSELQSLAYLVCRLLLEKKKKSIIPHIL